MQVVVRVYSECNNVIMIGRGGGKYIGDRDLERKK